MLLISMLWLTNTTYNMLMLINIPATSKNIKDLCALNKLNEKSLFIKNNKIIKIKPIDTIALKNIKTLKNIILAIIRANNSEYFFSIKVISLIILNNVL